MTFTETGLPAGTQWGVNFAYSVNYSTTSTMNFYYPNGTYIFVVTYVAGYAPSPNNGTLTINGSAVTQTISFSKAALYSVNFTESGLLAGTQWTVAISNNTGYFSVSNSSTTNTIPFVVINGTYSFYVSPVTGYNVSPYFGYVVVSGGNVTQKIVYYPSSTPVFSVFFQESGYPGSFWNVSFNGVNQTTPSLYPLVDYLVPNGTYQFSVSTYTGYTGYPTTGTVQVNGMNVSQQTFYYPNSVQVANVTFTGSSMHSGFGLLVEIINSTNFTNNVTLLLINTSASNTIIAYLPVGNYISAVGEFNGPSLVYGNSVYNESEVVYINYLNITSSSPVTVNTVFPTLWQVTLIEQNLANVNLWSVFGESSSLVSLLSTNQTPTPGPTPYSIFMGNANLTLSQTTMTVYLPNGSYDYAASVGAYNQTGSFNVTGSPLSVYISFPKAFYSVTFFQTGLPTGYYWGVTINGVSEYNYYGGAIVFTLPNGSYSFAIGNIFGYQASPASGVVVVSGSNISQTIAFTYTPVYDVTFFETGLPNGTLWSVTLNGTTISSTTSSIVFYVPTGNYPFTINASSGYIMSPSNGTVSVIGTSVYVPVSSMGYGYSVKFTETGLPSGTMWYVNLSNGKSLSTGSSSVTAELANGSYNYTVSSANSKYTANSGSFSVSGSSQSVSIAFASSVPIPVNYTVTFTESGLPAGTSWSITLNGTTHSSTSTSLTFNMTNGTYAFSVGNVSGYISAPSSGSLTVSGSPRSQTIAYSKQTPTSSKSNLGLSTMDYEIIGGVAVVAVVAGIAGLMFSRRGKKF